MPFFFYFEPRYVIQQHQRPAREDIVLLCMCVVCICVPRQLCLSVHALSRERERRRASSRP